MGDKEACASNAQNGEGPQKETKTAATFVSVGNIQLANPSIYPAQKAITEANRSYFSMTSSWILKEDLVKAALRLRRTFNQQKSETSWCKNSQIFYINPSLFPAKQITSQTTAQNSEIFNKKSFLYLCSGALQYPIVDFETRAQDLHRITIVDEVGLLSEVAHRNLANEFLLNYHPNTMCITWPNEQSSHYLYHSKEVEFPQTCGRETELFSQPREVQKNLESIPVISNVTLTYLKVTPRSDSTILIYPTNNKISWRERLLGLFRTSKLPK